MAATAYSPGSPSHRAAQGSGETAAPDPGRPRLSCLSPASAPSRSGSAMSLFVAALLALGVCGSAPTSPTTGGSATFCASPTSPSSCPCSSGAAARPSGWSSCWSAAPGLAVTHLGDRADQEACAARLRSRGARRPARGRRHHRGRRRRAAGAGGAAAPGGLPGDRLALRPRSAARAPLRRERPPTTARRAPSGSWPRSAGGDCVFWAPTRSTSCSPEGGWPSCSRPKRAGRVTRPTTPAPRLDRPLRHRGPGDVAGPQGLRAPGGWAPGGVRGRLGLGSLPTG